MAYKSFVGWARTLSQDCKRSQTETEILSLSLRPHSCLSLLSLFLPPLVFRTSLPALPSPYSLSTFLQSHSVLLFSSQQSGKKGVGRVESLGWEGFTTDETRARRLMKTVVSTIPMLYWVLVFIGPTFSSHRTGTYLPQGGDKTFGKR